MLPLRDTDQDGAPDFFDRDSDAEGADDVIEGGGADVDADGRIDSTLDVDGNGLADAVDVGRGGAPLSLPDGDRDGIWDFQDPEDSPAIRVTGGGLCATSPTGDRAPAPVSALLPLLALVLAARRRRLRKR